MLSLLLWGCSHSQNPASGEGTSTTTKTGGAGGVDQGSLSHFNEETITVEIGPGSEKAGGEKQPPGEEEQKAAVQNGTLCEQARAARKPSAIQEKIIDEKVFCANGPLCDGKIDGYLSAAMRRGLGAGHFNGKVDIKDARLYATRSLAFADGRKSGRNYDILYVAEYGMSTLRAVKLNPEGEAVSMHTVAGKAEPPYETEDNPPFDFKFQFANALALSPDQKYLYVLEYSTNHMTQIPLADDGLKAKAMPVAMTRADGSSLLADISKISTWNQRSFAFSPDGRFIYLTIAQSSLKNPLDKTSHGLFKLELEKIDGIPSGKILSMVRMETLEGEKILERNPGEEKKVQISGAPPTISCLDANADEKIELDECLLYLVTPYFGMAKDYGAEFADYDGPGIYKIELDKEGDAKRATLVFPYTNDVLEFVTEAYQSWVNKNRTQIYLTGYNTPLAVIPLNPQTGDPLKTGRGGILPLAGQPCPEDRGFADDLQNPMNAKMDYPLAFAMGRDEKHLYTVSAAEDYAVRDIFLDPESGMAKGVATLLPKISPEDTPFTETMPQSPKGFVVNKAGTDCYLGSYSQQTIHHCRIDPKTGKITLLEHVAGEHGSGNFGERPQFTQRLTGPTSLALREQENNSPVLYLAERYGKIRVLPVIAGTGKLEAPQTLQFRGNDNLFGGQYGSIFPSQLVVSPDGKFLYAAVTKNRFYSVWLLILSEDGLNLIQAPKRLDLQEEGKESAFAMAISDQNDSWRLFFSTIARNPQVFAVKLDKNTGDILENEKPSAIFGNGNWPQGACGAGAPKSFAIGQVISLAVDPKKKELYAWSHSCHALYKLPLTAEGLPDPLANAEPVFSSDRFGVFTGGPLESRSANYPSDLVFHPNGKVLYLNDTDGNAVLDLR